METILESNPRCADCLEEEVHSVSMDFGVSVCELCSIAHQVIGFPIKKVTAVFSPEELAFLCARGNLEVNKRLLLNCAPWIATPQEFDFDFVRLFYIENKYVHESFAVQTHYQVVNLDQYWFYLDEVSARRTQIKGPCSREQLSKLLSQFPSAYVWHPIVSRTWTLAERVTFAINPSLSQSAVYEVCFKTLALQDLPFPNLKGPLQVASDQAAEPKMKWVVLVGLKLRLFRGRLANDCECDIPLADHEPSLAQRGPDIYMVLISNQRKWSFFAPSAEILEWFHAVRCVRYLLHTLGDTISVPTVDESELHICNVKSNPEYIGEKLLEGLMKADGDATHWVVLRKKGIYCYARRLDKVCKQVVPLDAQTRLEEEGTRFRVTTQQHSVTLLIESQAEKQAWMSAVATLIDEEVRTAESQQTVQTYKL